jgi:hypothetical protein
MHRTILHLTRRSLEHKKQVYCFLRTGWDRMQPVRSAETLEIYWPWPHVHVVSATQFQQPRTAGQSGRLGINAQNLFNEIEIGDGKLDAMQLNKLSRRDDTAKETNETQGTRSVLCSGWKESVRSPAEWQPNARLEETSCVCRLTGIQNGIACSRVSGKRMHWCNCSTYPSSDIERQKGLCCLF